MRNELIGHGVHCVAATQHDRQSTGEHVRCGSAEGGVDHLDPRRSAVPAISSSVAGRQVV
jgi:hypothetical protein